MHVVVALNFTSVQCETPGARFMTLRCIGRMFPLSLNGKGLSLSNISSSLGIKHVFGISITLKGELRNTLSLEFGQTFSPL